MGQQTSKKIFCFNLWIMKINDMINSVIWMQVFLAVWLLNSIKLVKIIVSKTLGMLISVNIYTNKQQKGQDMTAYKAMPTNL